VTYRDYQRLSDIVAAIEPGTPRRIVRMRDHLAHRYFDTSHTVLQGTVDHDLPELEDAARRMIARATDAATNGD
jgi:uncharacterized protein with HEPN domain